MKGVLLRLILSAAGSGALIGMYTTKPDAPTKERLENFTVGALVGITNLAIKLKPSNEETTNAGI